MIVSWAGVASGCITRGCHGAGASWRSLPLAVAPRLHINAQLTYWVAWHAEPEPGQLRLLDVDERLVLPTNSLIRVLVTSSDVIHSWAVPSLGLKIDAVPGRLNQVRGGAASATEPCWQLCNTVDGVGAGVNCYTNWIQGWCRCSLSCARVLDAKERPARWRVPASPPAVCLAHAPACAVPQVWLTIQRPGVFYGQCSELCGANHAFMPIVVEAVTPRQYLTEYLKKWMQ